MNKKENLGVEFNRRIEYYLRLISENPFYFRVNPKKRIQVPVGEISYIIIYWVDENVKLSL